MTELTKREQIAAMAMQGIMSLEGVQEGKMGTGKECHRNVVKESYSIADAMLAESDEQGENPGDDLGEFDWSQAKPGMAFKHISYIHNIYIFMGPDLNIPDYVMVQDSEYCLQRKYKYELIRVPEHDVEVAR